MNDSATSDINTTTTTTNSNNLSKNHSNNNNNKKPFKQIWQLGNKHLVVIDESIIEK